jgi:hypothetical protein
MDTHEAMQDLFATYTNSQLAGNDGGELLHDCKLAF